MTQDFQTGKTFKLAEYDDWHNARLAIRLSVTNDPIHAVALSADGRLLAIGNDVGRLEIHRTGPGLERMRTFVTGATIRSLLWHPSKPQCLFVGCGNGNIYRLNFDFQEKGQANDIIAFGRVNGFVHVIAFNEPKEQIAVGYGHEVVLFDKAFNEPGNLGAKKLLHTPKVHNGADIRFHPFARGIHFLDDETVLVAFFGRVGIIAYSTSNGEVLWGLPLSFTALMVCSSSLSPSRRLLAIANTRRGVDWYSTTHRRFLMSTKYDVEIIRQTRNLVVGLDFIDDITVAVGHVNGKLVFAQLGMSSIPPEFSIGSATQAIQTVCCGYIDGTASVVTVLPIDSENKNETSGTSGQEVVVVRIPEQSTQIATRGTQAINSTTMSLSSPSASAGSSSQVDAISQGSLSKGLTAAYIILAFAIVIEIYCGGATGNYEQRGSVGAGFIASTTTTTVFLNKVETVTSIAITTQPVRQVEIITETITALETMMPVRDVKTLTVTKTKSIAMDRLQIARSQETAPSTCICILTGAWNTQVVEQTKHSQYKGVTT